MKSPSFVRTSVFRLTLAYILLFSLSVCILLTFIYWSSIRYIENQTDIAIDTELVGLREQYQRRGLEGLVEIIAERLREYPQTRSIYLFATGNKRPLAGNLNRWPEIKNEASGWVSFKLIRQDQTISARARIIRLSGGYLLLIGRDIQEFQQISNAFKRTLFWGGGLTVLLGLFAGILTSKYMLRRVEEINTTCEKVMQGDLNLRVATYGNHDEFDQLGDYVNKMLDRVNELIDSVRNVGNNIAHELRTPLTTLRNSLEELKSDVTPAAQEKLEEALTDADSLLETFAALLRISKLEAGSYVLNKQKIKLSDLVTDSCELYQALAEEKGIHLETEIKENTTTEGDRDLLFQMMTNVLDNAIKFSRPNDNINIKLICKNNFAEFIVSDSGPGVPENLYDKVLERFYRVNAKDDKSGSGLGLSLVKAIIDLHHGTLSFEDNQPGLIVKIHLPLYQA